MQLIGEVYHLMQALGISQEQMAETFQDWNSGELDSFLIDITKDILRYKDKEGQYLLPQIRDTAGQKGTGKWTAIAALNYGVPVTLIGEAVFSRCLSALKVTVFESTSRGKGGQSSINNSGQYKKHKIGQPLLTTIN